MGTLVVFIHLRWCPGGGRTKTYNATGAKYRVKNSNTDNLWTDWKSFNEKFQLVHAQALIGLYHWIQVSNK